MVVFHANIRTIGRRQNADRFHKGSSVVNPQIQNEERFKKCH